MCFWYKLTFERKNGKEEPQKKNQNFIYSKVKGSTYIIKG